jgi:hypothetical protein
MARRGSFSATFNGVRYLLFAFGLLLIVGSCQKTEGRTSDDLLAFAWFCVVVGFPFPLLVLPFRFVSWLLRLFGIGKRKPQAAPVSQMRVTVEWGDDPATDKQLGFIRHLGGNPPDGLTKSAASDMIDALLAEKRGRM